MSEDRIVLTDEATRLLITMLIQHCPNHGRYRSNPDLDHVERKMLDETSISSRINKEKRSKKTNIKPDRWTGSVDCSTCFITKLLHGTGFEGQCGKMGEEYRGMCRRCGVAPVPLAGHVKYCEPCRKQRKLESDYRYKARRRELEMVRRAGFIKVDDVA
jgi:hypothetical protein